MSAIVGIIGRCDREDGHELLQQMLAATCHEAFYQQATLHVPEMGIYAGAVATAGATQGPPLVRNEDGAVLLLLAGECFAADEVLTHLRNRGHVLGSGPNEWIVHAYEDSGPAFVASLNGLFSGLLVDRRKRIALLFNDRYGAERLYAFEAADGLFFASEAKAILRVQARTRRFDPNGLAQFLVYGCTLGALTLFQDVRAISGGSLWTFEGPRCRKSRYFSPQEWEQQDPLPPRLFQEELARLLRAIAPQYARGADPIGISLTAGLDTRMLMASLPPDPDRMVAFTYSGEQVDPLDVRIAARVAGRLGLKHHALRLEPDFFSDFSRWADRTVYVTDGYFGVTGAHEIYMSARARQLAPVRLTGNYGGEVLRGVSTFKPNDDILSRLNREARRAAANAIANADFESSHPITFAAFKEVPWNLYGNLAAGRSQLGFRTPYLDNAFVQLAYRAPRGAATMRDVCTGLIRRAHPALAEIPTDKGYLGNSGRAVSFARHAWCRATFKLDYINNEGFPNALAPVEPLYRGALQRLGLLGLHKHLHYRNWFQAQLSEYVTERLSDPSLRRSEVWDQARLDHLLRQHRSRRGNHVVEIGAVLTLESLERQLFTSSRPVDDANHRHLDPAGAPTS